MTDPTNEQLDRFVATEVMGWTYYEGDGIDTPPCGYYVLPDGSVLTPRDYYPTANPAQALESLEKWAKWPLGRRPRLSWDCGVWHVYLDGDGVHDAPKSSAPTLPLAICRALVEAMWQAREGTA